MDVERAIMPDARTQRPQQIIVAGIPRSGTTMLFRALAEMSAGNTTPKDYQGPILKTHTFHPRKLPVKDAKAVFLFGDVTLSVLSTKLRRYNAEHFANCGAPKFDPDHQDIFDHDFLNYEKMYIAWTHRHPFPVACVRYERLHELRPYLEAFLDRPIQLPPRRSRRTTLSGASRADILRIGRAYASLIARIKDAPDFAMYRGVERPTARPLQSSPAASQP